MSLIIGIKAITFDLDSAPWGDFDEEIGAGKIASTYGDL